VIRRSLQEDLVLFALCGTRDYGESVSRELAIPLSQHEERDFEDGEHKMRPLVSVRNKHVFVLQSLYEDATHSIDDKLCRLLFFLGAVREASAATVTVVLPYLAYARQDRRAQLRDPVTTRYVAALFEAVGVDRVVAMDVHNLAAYDNSFRCRKEHLEATELFAEHFAQEIGDREVAVVSPDAGGIGRAERFRARLALRLRRPITSAFVEKYRTDGTLTGEAFGGDVRGRSAIIYDDMISTGATVARAAAACRKHGAKEIFVAATHGLFVGRANALLTAAQLDAIVVTDTVATARVPGIGIDVDVKILKTAPMVAKAIEHIHSGVEEVG
jgi:ribose-phosphate pyrophosphokinase